MKSYGDWLRDLPVDDSDGWLCPQCDLPNERDDEGLCASCEQEEADWVQMEFWDRQGKLQAQGGHDGV